MIDRMRGVAAKCAVVSLGIVLATACGSRPANVTVDRLTITVTVLPDGSAQVTEELVARVGASPLSEFRRNVPAWRHDGVSDIAATMDGRAVPVGESPGHIQMQGGPSLDVRWLLTPLHDSSRTFTLQYRAAHVVATSGIRGVVSWLAVPPGRDFDLGDVSITIALPEETVLLQDPWVEEAGWRVTRQPHGMTATRTGLPPGESATAGIEFTIDKMAVVTAQWQLDADLTGEFVPAFVSAALFMLVIGAGVLAMLRFKYPPWPAVSGGTRVSGRARRQFRRSIDADRGNEGLIEAERVSVARDLRTAGVAVSVLGLAVWAVVAFAITQFGMWPLAVPWSILIVGGMFLAGASRFDVLSERGAQACVLYSERVRDERTPV